MLLLLDSRDVIRGLSQPKRRTLEYRRRLVEIYGGYIDISPELDYSGPSRTTSHSCKLCGQTFECLPKTLLNGGGCTNCRSRATHISAMMQHLVKIRKLGLTFTIPPTAFTGKSRLSYACQSCGCHYMAHPAEVERPDYECHGCVKRRASRMNSRCYDDRIEYTFSGTIKRLDKYHLTRHMLHECRETQNVHLWHATSEDLLRGIGCPRCKSGHHIKQAVTFSYRNRNFIVSSEAEKRAVKLLTREYKSNQLRTKLSYPIPMLTGNHAPAFLVKDRKLLLDIIPFSKFHMRKLRMKRSYRAAEKLGFHYGVIVYDKTCSLLLLTKSYLVDEEFLLPADFKLLQLNSCDRYFAKF